MNNEYYEEYDEGVFEEAPYVDDSQIQQILAEYHRKQMVENLTGPSVSFALHTIFLSLMFVFIVTKPRKIEPEIVVTITEMEEVKLEDVVKDEIQDIEDPEFDEDTPTSEPSEAPTNSPSPESALDDFSDEAPESDDSAIDETVIDFVKTNSVWTFNGPLGGRTNARRKKALTTGGASSANDPSVNRALRWLASVQNSNGSWGTNHQPAYTGIALLVFLAHGETPLSEKYGKTVQDAMRWLATYANSSDLKQIAHRRHSGAYGHGMATYAISESYAMTKVPFMRIAMDNAIAVIIEGQQANGGFGYGYERTRWDMSVAGWQMQALKAARVAGCTHPDLKDAIQKSIMFTRKTAYTNGKFGYANENGGPASGTKPNMTGIGAVSLQLLGARSCTETKRALETIGNERYELYKGIRQNPQTWSQVASNHLYGFYYDTQAIFNSKEEPGGKKRWKEWRAVFEKTLIRAQNPEGYWETEQGHGFGPNLNGRVFATCLSALQLEVYYRYLPSFDIDKMDKVAKEDALTIESVGTGENGEEDGILLPLD